MHGVRNTRVVEHAGKMMLGGWWGRDCKDCKGTQECKGMQCRGMQEMQGVGGAGAQRHTWTGGWKGCGIQRARDARMRGNAFMEDGAGKGDASEN